MQKLSNYLIECRLSHFRQFIAVDWSGAKGPRLPGIQVAACGKGNAPPKLIPPPPRTSTWTRQGVWEYIVHCVGNNSPVLAAFDMGLGLPYLDREAYFPDHPQAPRTIRQLWKAVERYGQRDADYYGGAIAMPPSPFATYYNAPGHRGSRFDIGRHRLTEAVCRKWTRPSSVFNGVGAGSVGMGSLAGMRLLHRIAHAPRRTTAIWPVLSVPNPSLVVVEMFPRLYAKLAGQDPRAWRDPDFLQSIWSFYQTSTSRTPHPRTEDEMDALLSAAAIRHLSQNPVVWNPSQMTRKAAAFEGWIFGVI